MTSLNTSKTYGITFIDALAILFIGLKLGHIITWSWFWVLSPLWIPPLLLVLSAILLLIVTGIRKVSK